MARERGLEKAERDDAARCIEDCRELAVELKAALDRLDEVQIRGMRGSKVADAVALLGRGLLRRAVEKLQALYVEP